MVRRVVFNPILKGLRLRNKVVAKRINKTGRRRCVKAPAEELLQRECPHLAFVESARYDRLIARLRAKGELYSFPKQERQDPHLGRPKKRTRFPGQQVYCGICGLPFVFGGHGQTDHMMCSGARGYQCWNGVSLDAVVAANKLATAVFEWMQSISEFDPLLIADLHSEFEQLLANRSSGRAQLEREMARIEREIANSLAAVRAGMHSTSLQMDVQRLERERDDIRFKLHDLSGSPVASLQLPSMDEVRQQALNQFKDLALTSHEFSRLMQAVAPKIVVYPVQLLDGGKVSLRARFSVSLASFLSPDLRCPSVTNHLTTELTVDAFDYPQRAAFRERVIQLRDDDLNEAEIAHELGLTITAIQRAAALQRLMDRLGVADPYRQLHEPPVGDGKLRRHLHPRYRFNPLPPGDAA